MPDFAEIQARNRLLGVLWQVAVDEAYSAKDAQRRMQELQGLTELQVVEVYYRYHPEMREWFDHHVERGTCEAAIQELQTKLAQTRKARAEQRRKQEEWWEAEQQRMRDRSEQAKKQWIANPDADPGDWIGAFSMRPARTLELAGPSEETKETQAAPIPPETIQKAEHPKNRGGRPPQWDWRAFYVEMVRRANTPDGLPDRTELTKQITDWCMSKWGDTPSESLLRDRISELYPT